MELIDNWVIEYNEYKEQNFKGNKGIYDKLSMGNLEVIKCYYRWRSKEKVRRLCKDLILRVADDGKLSDSGVNDWVYDGCEDTGSNSGGKCSNGRVTRYIHYAYSSILNRYIKFSLTGVGEYFIVGKEKVRAIRMAQEEILEEIKQIKFVLDTNKSKDYADLYYKDINDIFDYLKGRGRLGELFSNGWQQQITRFISEGIPLTKSMVCKLEYVRDNYYKRMLIEDKQLLEMGELGVDKGDIEKLRENSGLYVVRLSLGYISDEVRKGNKWDNISGLIGIVIKFIESYNRLKELGVKDFIKFIESSKQSVVYVNASNGKRKATKREKDAMGSYAYTVDEYIISKDVYKLLHLYGWCIYGYGWMYKEYKFDGLGYDEIKKLEASIKGIKVVVEWILSERFKGDYKWYKEEYKRKQEYKDYEIDEISGERSIGDIVDYILLNYKKGSTDKWLLNTAYDISESNKMGKNLSDKQRSLLRKAYDMLSGIKGNNKPDIVKQAEYVLNHLDDMILVRNFSFEIKVCESVVKTWRVTEKQRLRVEKAYRYLTQGIIDGDMGKVFIEVEDSEDKRDGYGVEFIEDSGNGIEPIYSDDIEAKGLPTLSDMSSILGKGGLV